MKKILWLIIAIYLPTLVVAQGELDEQETVYFNDERTWGFSLGTSGIAVNFRNGRRINAFKKKMWAIDFSTLIHPKKHSLQSYYNPTSFFSFGKLNSIANFRFSMGLQKEIFRKIDKGGIAIRWFYLGGPALVWQKPIYYEVVSSSTGYPVETEEKRFSPDMSIYDIVRRASYFKGFGESSFVPGVHATTGLSFDYSTESKHIYALEIGVSADVFIKELDIMYGDNPFAFVQVYGTLRFGKIVDRMKVRLKRTRREMRKRAEKMQENN